MEIPAEILEWFKKAGKEGGEARAKKLSAEQRKKIARDGGLASAAARKAADGREAP